MKIKMDQFIQVLAQALDTVEKSLLGVSDNHGKRIASLCAAMGRQLGLDDDALSDLVSCALLHDNALTEYIQIERGEELDPLSAALQPEERARGTTIGTHCEIGQRNIDILPFKGDVSGFIRYHHERADGRGPFGLSEGYYPLGAELIAIADSIDIKYHLQRFSLSMLPALRDEIAGCTCRDFGKRACEAMLAVMDGEMLASLRDDRIGETCRNSIPVWEMEMEDPHLIPIGELVARIIDYKSVFTRKHTQQIANRSWVMAEYYGYDLTQKIQLYLAAALHDIGKLAVPSEVLEKPGKLTTEEFEIIKGHIVHSRKILEGAEGMEIITRWAVNHHEKLDGSGYSQGATADELDFNSRLMACIDVYQAVSEERPYHPRRSHAGTMPILNSMVSSGALDGGIVKDLNTVMEAWSGKDVGCPRV